MADWSRAPLELLELLVCDSFPRGIARDTFHFAQLHIAHQIFDLRTFWKVQRCSDVTDVTCEKVI